jgi:hypothetical protein
MNEVISLIQAQYLSILQTISIGLLVLNLSLLVSHSYLFEGVDLRHANLLSSIAV